MQFWQKKSVWLFTFTFTVLSALMIYTFSPTHRTLEPCFSFKMSDEIDEIVFSKNGVVVAARCELRNDNTHIVVHDANTGVKLCETVSIRPVNSIVLSNAGQVLVIAEESYQPAGALLNKLNNRAGADIRTKLRFIQIRDGSESATLTLAVEHAWKMAIDPNDRILTVGDARGIPHLVSLKHATIIETINDIDLGRNGWAATYGMVFSPSGKTLAVSIAGDIHLMDVNTKKWKRTAISHPGMGGMSFLNGTNHLLMTFGDGHSIKIWNTKSETEVQNWEHEILFDVQDVVLLKEDRWAATFGESSVDPAASERGEPTQHGCFIDMFDMQNGTDHRILKPEPYSVVTALCPETMKLATGGFYGDIHIWNVHWP